MNKQKKIINLEPYRSPNSKILSGRNEGFKAREKLRLDELDNDDNNYLVTIPKDTWSINSSFFLGLFGESIRKRKEDGFKEKYKFECTESVMDDINDGIKEALKNNTALDE